jgi:cytochrome c-type biogenesis protein CcmH
LVFWFVITALTLAVAGLLIRALIRPPLSGEDVIEYDLRIYRDQLKEVDRDLARKVITAEEAERARLEISRRILEADKARTKDATITGTDGITAQSFGLALVGGAAALGIATYLMIGAPGYGDLALADRIAITEENRANRPSQAEAEANLPPLPPVEADPDYLRLIEQLRTTLQDRPNDLQGHMFLAQHEANLGNLKASYTALARIIEIKGDDATADDYAAYANMLAQAANGYISPVAVEAIEAALTLDPTNETARYYIGLSEYQIGRPDRAFAVWRRLLEESQPTDPWVPLIRTQIEDAALRAGVEYTMAPAGTVNPGPTMDDIAAAEEMTPAERMEMIEGMVAGLSDRLATDGGTASDWARLIAAYGVLGRTDQARAIWDEAQTVFAGREADLDLLTAAAARAGLTE